MVMPALSYHHNTELCVPPLGMLKVKPEVSNNCITKNINMQHQLETVYCDCGGVLPLYVKTYIAEYYLINIFSFIFLSFYYLPSASLLLFFSSASHIPTSSLSCVFFLHVFILPNLFLT